MRILAVLLLATLALLATVAEPLAPRVDLEAPPDVVGAATPLKLVATDRGTGLADLEVRVVPAGGGDPVVVAREAFPRASWYGSGVHERTLEPVLDVAKSHLPEGPATLEVVARDHSWLSTFRRGPTVSRPIAIDTTPPTLEVLTSQHVARSGGAECVVYRVGADASTSGVQVGELFFPGTAGFFADPSLRAALFAIPDAQAPAQVEVVATDAAGNRRGRGLDLTVKPQRFAEKTLTIDDTFLRRKVPELLRENGLPPTDDLVAGYLTINRDLRKTTEGRLRQLCGASDAVPRWQGGLLRMPNTAPLSGFADRRTYLHDGKVIDHQTHLGFDLASLKSAPVPAAAPGRVVFVGPLGIYGTTVILDHGLGLFTLYGHLSTAAIAAGANVGRGDTIGATGETGLAGGDHLHFSVMIHGVHVDPVEWWDAHWIHDHVDARLAAYPAAPPSAAAAAAPSSASQTPPAAGEKPS